MRERGPDGSREPPVNAAMVSEGRTTTDKLSQTRRAPELHELASQPLHGVPQQVQDSFPGQDEVKTLLEKSLRSED